MNKTFMDGAFSHQRSAVSQLEDLQGFAES